MTDTLLPCPFCGSGLINEVVNTFRNNVAGTSIRCDECEVETAWYVNKEHAIATWNRRTSDDLVRALVDVTNDFEEHIGCSNHSIDVARAAIAKAKGEQA